MSAPRKLGMQEHVLPLIKPGDEPGNQTQSINYPVQGSGITCSKIYNGHEGNLNMNIGEWKRGSAKVAIRWCVQLQVDRFKRWF